MNRAAIRAQTRARERGSITPLLVGFAVVLLIGIAVVINASAAYIQRQGLAGVADGAALSGADAGAQVVHTLGIPQGRLPQLRSEVAAAVRTHLQRTGATTRYPGIRATVTLTADGHHVQVRLSAPVDLPLGVPGISRRAVISAHSTAAVQVRR